MLCECLFRNFVCIVLVVALMCSVVVRFVLCYVSSFCDYACLKWLGCVVCILDVFNLFHVVSVCVEYRVREVIVVGSCRRVVIMRVPMSLFRLVACCVLFFDFSCCCMRRSCFVVDSVMCMFVLHR